MGFASMQFLGYGLSTKEAVGSVVPIVVHMAWCDYWTIHKVQYIPKLYQSVCSALRSTSWSQKEKVLPSPIVMV